ncbi:MAG: DNA polymerase [Gammaproteobacteria bacterium]|nr:DNA polymerase [Gammaproteobacteria bacterium]MCW8982463.1 DNA polymerase [Gammaproteobacteria bacterium]
MFDINQLDPDIYLKGKFLTLDLETTNKHKGDAYADNSLLLAVWRLDGKTKFKWGNIFNQQELVQDVESVDFIIAHNAKFELKWLRQCGLDLTKVLVYDTQIGEYVLAGNTAKLSQLGLGKVAPKYNEGVKDAFIDNSMKAQICPSELPKSLVLRRCKKDVRQTEGVFKKQLQKLRKRSLLPVMYTRCIFTPCLADMEYNGLKLDADRVATEYAEVDKALQEVTREMNVFTGGVNPKSPKQMGEFVYDVLKFKAQKNKDGTENRSVSAKVLETLNPRTKKQLKFIELRKKQAKLTARMDKALKNFMACVEADDILRAQFNQTVTKTHRLSSSGAVYSVQFQNLPREYKPMFTARHKGWYMGEIDGAQLEFRVAAFLGQDQQAVYDINNGVDVHTFTAETITAAGQETDRQTAKAHTFKPLFGGLSGTEAEQEYYKAFQKKYAGIAETQEGWVREVVRTKQLRLASGLIAYWPDAKRTPSGWVTNTPQIYNLPVQSLATAEIIPIAVTKLWHDLKANKMESFLCNTVHDSAISEIKPEEVLQFQDISVRAFSDFVYKYLETVYNIQFNVPLGAGLKIGYHWGEGDEEVAKYIQENGTFREVCEYDKGELKYVPPLPNYEEVI